MAGPTSTARAELAAELEPVWPGRVYPYPPMAPRVVAGLYVGETSAGWTVDDVGAAIWSGVFAVRLIADGADRAAAALLDDMADQAYRAVARSARFYPDGVVWEPHDVDGVTVLPAYTFTVTTPLDVVTWCAGDDPVAVAVPPQPVGETP